MYDEILLFLVHIENTSNPSYAKEMEVNKKC